MKEEEFDDLEDWLVFFYTLFCNSWRWQLYHVLFIINIGGIDSKKYF
jgi:hypothetical protein